MQFKSLLSFGLLGLAAAAPALEVASGVKDIVAAMGTIEKSLGAFDTSVKALTEATPAAQATAELKAKSAEILKAISGAKKAAETSQSIPLLEAVSLTTASATLTKVAASAVDSLIAKKPVIAKAGQEKEVLSQLQSQKTETMAFIAALKAKLPSAVAPVAEQQAGQVTAALQKGIAAYSK